MKNLIPFLLLFSVVLLSCECPNNTREVDFNPDQNKWFSEVDMYWTNINFYNVSTPIDITQYSSINDEFSYPQASEQARCKPEIKSRRRFYGLNGNYQGYFDYDFEIRAKDPYKLFFDFNSDYGYSRATGYVYTDANKPIVISNSAKPVNMEKSFFKYVGDTTVHGKSYKEVYHLEIVFENMPNQYRFLLSRPLGVVYMFGPNNTKLNK